jgi:predicted small secreted protein
MKNKNILLILIVSYLAGCATTSGVGPEYQSENEKIVIENSDPFDVSVAVFNPGLPKDSSYGESGVWPELRRAESMYMAVQLRDTLAESGNYGAVRVTPDLSSNADLYIKAKIEESNGEDLKLKVTVVDSTGKQWISKKYSHRVEPITFNNPRNKDAKNVLKVDPYEPIFKKINSDIAKYMKKRIKTKNADIINTVADIRYAQNFSPDAFSDILTSNKGKFRLKGKPDLNDPMMARIQKIQYRDKMFIDNMQSNYEGFSADMIPSYRIWQEQSFLESKSAREAASAAFWQGVAGALVLAATVAAAGDSDSYAGARNSAIVGGAVAGSLFQGSFKSSAEAKIHRDSLNEIAASIDGSLSPSVIEMEGTTVTLTGSADEQFTQWKDILKKIYLAETEKTIEVL